MRRRGRYITRRRSSTQHAGLRSQLPTPPTAITSYCCKTSSLYPQVSDRLSSSPLLSSETLHSEYMTLAKSLSVEEQGPLHGKGEFVLKYSDIVCIQDSRYALLFFPLSPQSRYPPLLCCCWFSSTLLPRPFLLLFSFVHFSYSAGSTTASLLVDSIA